MAQGAGLRAHGEKKFEIRNPKLETISKFKIQTTKTTLQPAHFSDF